MAIFGDFFASCVFREPRAPGFRPASSICTKATPRVEVWQRSNLQRLRLGEEKKERKNKRQDENIMVCSIPHGNHNYHQIFCFRAGGWSKPKWNCLVRVYTTVETVCTMHICVCRRWPCCLTWPTMDGFNWPSMLTWCLVGRPICQLCWQSCRAWLGYSLQDFRSLIGRSHLHRCCRCITLYFTGIDICKNDYFMCTVMVVLSE